MKKFLFLMICLFISMPVMAYQNYILMADKQISNIEVSNSDILKIEPMCTTKGKGSSMMLIPKNMGSTRLSFCKGRKKINLCITIFQDKTCIEKINGVKIVPVDLPLELNK